jgi:NADH:ubiquinone oxidoreductase subunit 6 (subunit J)
MSAVTGGAVVLCLTCKFVNMLIAVILPGAIGAFLVIMVHSETSGGEHNTGPLILGVSAASVALLIFFAYFTMIAINKQVFKLLKKREKEDEGRTQVQSAFWRFMAVFGYSLSIAVWIVLAAIGPESWDKYSGSSNQKETLQIWLTLMAEGFRAIVVVLTFFVLDPAGDLFSAAPMSIVPTTTSATSSSASEEQTQGTEPTVPLPSGSEYVRHRTNSPPAVLRAANQRVSKNTLTHELAV